MIEKDESDMPELRDLRCDSSDDDGLCTICSPSRTKKEHSNHRTACIDDDPWVACQPTYVHTHADAELKPLVLYPMHASDLMS